MRSQCSGQAGVIAEALVWLDVVDSGCIHPGRPATATACLLGSDRQPAFHQGFEVLARGVLMHTGSFGDRGDGDRHLLLLQELENDRALAGYPPLWIGSPDRGRAEGAGTVIFHRVYCSKYECIRLSLSCSPSDNPYRARKQEQNMGSTERSVTDITVAASRQDAAALDDVRQHHAELAEVLATRVEMLLTTAAAGGEPFEGAHRRVAEIVTNELAVHTRAAEESLYPAAARIPSARLLIDGMLAENRALSTLMDQVLRSTEPVRIAALGYALRVLFDALITQENDLVLPLLATDPTVSLTETVRGYRDLRSEGVPAAAHRTGEGSCGCSAPDDGKPELDVRDIPHAIRHATVFGAFDAIAPGSSLVLIAPHDPLPLLRQLDRRSPGQLDVTYLERGPVRWRLDIARL